MMIFGFAIKARPIANISPPATGKRLGSSKLTSSNRGQPTNFWQGRREWFGVRV